MSNILEFYRFASPRGIPIKQLGEWTTTSTPTITVSPGPNDVYFVKSIGVLISNTADIGSSSVLVRHSSDFFAGVESKTITYSSVDDMISSFSPNTVSGLSCNLKGHLVFDVPVRLDASASETLTISKTGTDGITAGQINFAIAGWYIDNDTDL